MTRQVSLAALSVGLGLCIVGSAEACRVYQTPQTRVAHAYDAIVLAKIESAQYVDGLGDRQRPWRAVARPTSAVEGHVKQSVFEIGRTGQSAACDDGQSIAEIGETWVLYLQRRAEGGYTASASYPLSFARGIDPRFARKTP